MHESADISALCSLSGYVHGRSTVYTILHRIQIYMMLARLLSLSLKTQQIHGNACCSVEFYCSDTACMLMQHDIFMYMKMPSALQCFGWRKHSADTCTRAVLLMQRICTCMQSSGLTGLQNTTRTSLFQAINGRHNLEYTHLRHAQNTQIIALNKRSDAEDEFNC